MNFRKLFRRKSARYIATGNLIHEATSLANEVRDFLECKYIPMEDHMERVRELLDANTRRVMEKREVQKELAFVKHKHEWFLAFVHAAGLSEPMSEFLRGYTKGTDETSSDVHVGTPMEHKGWLLGVSHKEMAEKKKVDLPRVAV